MDPAVKGDGLPSTGFQAEDCHVKGYKRSKRSPNERGERQDAQSGQLLRIPVFLRQSFTTGSAKQQGVHSEFDAPQTRQNLGTCPGLWSPPSLPPVQVQHHPTDRWPGNNQQHSTQPTLQIGNPISIINPPSKLLHIDEPSQVQSPSSGSGLSSGEGAESRR